MRQNKISFRSVIGGNNSEDCDPSPLFSYSFLLCRLPNAKFVEFIRTQSFGQFVYDLTIFFKDGLRQMDLSLLYQLWSLNESIQEYKQMMEERVRGGSSGFFLPSLCRYVDDDINQFFLSSVNFAGLGRGDSVLGRHHGRYLRARAAVRQRQLPPPPAVPRNVELPLVRGQLRKHEQFEPRLLTVHEVTRPFSYSTKLRARYQASITRITVHFMP